MNIMNILKISAAAFAFTTFTVSASQIDAEFEPLDLQQAKLRGAFYKQHADSSTEKLLEAYHTSDFAPYLNWFKVQAKVNLGSYLDTLLSVNNTFILGPVACGAANQPSDRTRDAFKVALSCVIDATTQPQLAAYDLKVDYPENLNISSLTFVQDATQIAMAEFIGAWIDNLLPGANAPFLNGAVLVGGANQPADHTRDAFKAALTMRLSTIG